MHRQQNHTPPSALALFEKIICSCLALMELADILSRGAARRGARIWISAPCVYVLSCTPRPLISLREAHALFSYLLPVGACASSLYIPPSSSLAAHRLTPTPTAATSLPHPSCPERPPSRPARTSSPEQATQRAAVGHRLHRPSPFHRSQRPVSN